MDRPSRKTKVVNYSVDDFDDDDDDFACAKAPPSKKARDSVKEHERMKSKKSSTNSSSQESDTQSVVHTNRILVDDKVYARDLEAALTLSLLQTAESNKETCSDNRDVKIQPQQTDETTDPAALRLTNCSVDIDLLGLNQITSEHRSPCSGSRGQRKAASKAATKVTEQQRSMLKDEDEDYQPKGTPDAESDDDFSDQAESDDEEFTVKKAKTNNLKEKTAKKEKTKQPQVSKKENQPRPKPAKAKQQLTANPPVVRSPVIAKPAPAQKRPPSTPPISRPAVSATPSPAGGRIPKWNPPAQIGRSPVPSQSVSLKSPGVGLRLGLSRRVRVKPLHPSVAVHQTD